MDLDILIFFQFETLSGLYNAELLRSQNGWKCQRDTQQRTVISNDFFAILEVTNIRARRTRNTGLGSNSKTNLKAPGESKGWQPEPGRAPEARGLWFNLQLSKSLS